MSAYGYFNSDKAKGGGAERQLYLLSQKLKNQFDVHFIVGDFGQQKIEMKDGVTIHRSYKPNSNKSMFHRPIDVTRLFMSMKTVDADVYICRDNPLISSIVYSLTRSLRKKFILNIANDYYLENYFDSLGPVFKYIYCRAISGSCMNISQSQKQKNIIKDKFDSKSIVIPNGYEIPTESNGADGGEYILWVGRKEKEQKRPHLFLDLAERLPDIEFVMAGPEGSDKNYNEYIRNRAESLDNMTDLGFIDPSDIDELNKNSICLVNTSSYEGFPNTFLESWRYRKPVIGLDVNPGRFLEHEQAYANGDFDKLVQLVQKVFNDKNWRSELGKEARDTFESEFDINIIAEKYVDVINRCI